MLNSNSYKAEMIRRASEMLANEDLSGLESMAEALLRSANMHRISASEAKDKLANYEESFDINELAAAIDILIDVYAA